MTRSVDGCFLESSHLPYVWQHFGASGGSTTRFPLPSFECLSLSAAQELHFLEATFSRAYAVDCPWLEGNARKLGSKEDPGTRGIKGARGSNGVSIPLEISFAAFVGCGFAASSLLCGVLKLLLRCIGLLRYFYCYDNGDYEDDDYYFNFCCYFYCCSYYYCCYHYHDDDDDHNDCY